MRPQAVHLDLDGTLRDQDVTVGKVANDRYPRLMALLTAAPPCRTWLNRWIHLDAPRYTLNLQAYARLLEKWRLSGVFPKALHDDFHMALGQHVSCQVFAVNLGSWGPKPTTQRFGVCGLRDG